MKRPINGIPDCPFFIRTFYFGDFSIFGVGFLLGVWGNKKMTIFLFYTISKYKKNKHFQYKKTQNWYALNLPSSNLASIIRYHSSSLHNTLYCTIVNGVHYPSFLVSLQRCHGLRSGYLFCVLCFRCDYFVVENV